MIIFLPVWGTSPRARGKPEDRFFAMNIDRNIPACAGKTPGCSLGITSAQEHPRVRGENGHIDRWGGGHHGTSPRARGKPLLEPV